MSSTPSVQGRRALLAAIVISLAVAAAIAADRLASCARPSAAQETISIAAFGDSGSAYAVESGSSVLEAFEQEVLSLAAYSELRTTAEACVVGFIANESAEKTFSDLTQTLERGGWTAIASGSATAGSFAKSTGAYRWIFVSCSDIAGTTSVVIRCAQQEQKQGP